MTDFLADLAVDFLAEFSVDFLAPFFWQILRRIFAWMLVGIAGRFFLKTFLHPVEKRAWEIFSKKSPFFLENLPKSCWTKGLREFLKIKPQEIPAQILAACGLAAVLWVRMSDPAIAPRNPPDFRSGWESCHHANAKRYAGLLILLCLLSHELTRYSRATPGCCA